MTSWTELFNRPNLVSRKFYALPGTQVIVVPANAGIVRISAVGSGGMADQNVWGAGAAFARRKTTCTPGEQFSIQVGDPFHAINAGDALGDSKVTRVTGSVVLCKAARGGSAAGSSANCIGDVTRSGTPSPDYAHGGSPAGDDFEVFSLNFANDRYQTWVYYPRLHPAHGGGGIDREQTGPGYQSQAAGCGRVCLEFWRTDPGY